jgi:gas vesicle protein
MSNRDGFTGGFIAGALFGGVVGGILGTLLASNRSQEALPPDENVSGKNKKRMLKAPTEQSIEAARRGLEDKIAQLNDAIDDVREQLGNVNGRPETDETRWEEQMPSDR